MMRALSPRGQDDGPGGRGPIAPHPLNYRDTAGAPDSGDRLLAGALPAADLSPFYLNS
jgi:hypothetical protein